MAKTADGAEVTTSSKKDDYDGMVCSGCDVQPSANGGFIVRQSFRPPAEKPKKGDTCCGPSWIEPKTLVFKSIDEVATFLAGAFKSKK
jgi:hypothetical protein